ncbi:MAG: hypothetical protein ACQERC_06495 [Bacteroidota bacterium]
MMILKDSRRFIQGKRISIRIKHSFIKEKSAAVMDAATAGFNS